MTFRPVWLLAAGALALSVWAANDGRTLAFLVLGLLLGFAGAIGLRRQPLLVRTIPLRTPRNDQPAIMARALAILDGLHDPVIVLTNRANVAFANRAARIAYPALRPDQPMSFALRDPALLAAINGIIARGGEDRIELVERGAVERAYDCRIVALAEPDQRDRASAAALLTLTDITSQRALETMRVDFIANASHELRTPLASILGFTETLQGAARNDPAARDRFLAIMAGQARRMARLVDDLLSLSRIELKEHQVPKGVVDLAALIAETVGSLTELARERGVTLAFERPGGSIEVQGERDELLSVFDNLIENAIKYGRSGGRVDIAIGDGATPGEAVVSVRDYGPGIDPVHLPRLTERFYRVDNAMSRAEGGTGLGLALVKHTLNRHRGRLLVESAPGKGATFRAVLPKLHPQGPPGGTSL